MKASLLVQPSGGASEGAAGLVLKDYANVASDVEITTNRMDSPGQRGDSGRQPGRIRVRRGEHVQGVCDGHRAGQGRGKAI